VKGVTKDYTFWCERCGNWHQIAELTVHTYVGGPVLAGAVKLARRDGWRRTRTGFVCGPCAAAGGKEENRGR